MCTLIKQAVWRAANGAATAFGTGKAQHNWSQLSSRESFPWVCDLIFCDVCIAVITLTASWTTLNEILDLLYVRTTLSSNLAVSCTVSLRYNGSAGGEIRIEISKSRQLLTIVTFKFQPQYACFLKEFYVLSLPKPVRIPRWESI